MTKKVLLTGVSGFLGHHCATELIKSGYFVKGTVRDLRRKNEVLNGIKKEVDPNEKIEFIKLDLLKDDGWEDAVKGCEYILHVASPSSVDEPSHEDEYIKPTVEGTKRVLKYAQKAKIKRFVLTSSIVSLMGVVYDSESNTGIVDAKDWTDPYSKNINTYMKAKTLGEKEAWLSYRNLYFLNKVFMYPGIHGGHDVRDLAKIHVLAMTEKKANGKRLIPTTPTAHSFMEIAEILKENGYSKVSTKKGPIFMIKLMSLFDKEVKGMLPLVGNTISADNTETKKIFNWEPITFKKTILDCARSIENQI